MKNKKFLTLIITLVIFSFLSLGIYLSVITVQSEIVGINAAIITKIKLIFIIMAVISVCLLIFVMWQQNRNTNMLKRIAFYDEFTGAPTLVKFKLEAERFVSDNIGKNLLMVKFDIKQFKLINQILGDDIGDAVIKNIVESLKINTPGKYQRYARLHDDEFLVLHIYDKVEELIEIRDRFLRIFYEQMGENFNYDIKMISGHYYMSNENCTNVTEAIEKANIAHRRAKQTGQEICVYDKNFTKQLLKQKEIENKMKSALENNEFKVYLQPKYELKNETIVGAEALARWVNADGEMMLPGDFIPIFEQNGFVIKLDLYMFEQVCKIIHGWIEKGQNPVPVSVNFSRLHAFNSEFIDTICRITDKYEIPHSLIELELTESLMFDKLDMLQYASEKLHENGFILSMDDFGVGYSSLGLLKNLHVDVLKIDRSFLICNKNMLREKSIIESIMLLAKKLDINTVAEGVEIQEHIDLLREVDCDIVQGFYYAKPIPADEFSY